nr:hypothetical protein CFP56_29507 [Quercus suber]
MYFGIDRVYLTPKEGQDSLRLASHEEGRSYLALTMTKSKARLRGVEEEEGAQGEDTTHEGGDTDDEIDN